MIGVFVPWSEKSGVTGWIIDGDGCHIWTGDRTKSGYARIKIGRKNHKVHRLRYEQEVGPVPDGCQLDHYACSRGRDGCCNPRHCRPVTQRENILRSNGMAPRWLARTHCSAGHPLNVDNIVRWYFRKHGWRICKLCRKTQRKAKVASSSLEASWSTGC